MSDQVDVSLDQIIKISNDICEDPLSINENFNLFFYVLKNYETLDPQIFNRAWISITRAADSFTERLREIFSVVNDSVCSQISLSQDTRVSLFESAQEKHNYSNALKLLIHISCNFIQIFEGALTSQSNRQKYNDTYDDVSTPAAKRKKRQPRVNESEGDISFKDYDRYKERVLKNLLQLISMPLNKVADSPTEARDIVGQAMKACYSMIENSSINKDLTKNKDLLDIIFSLLGCGIEKYNQSLSFCLKLIQFFQFKEALAPLMADLFEFIVTRHDQRLLIGEILREIDRIDVKLLSRDSSCPRAISLFLVNLSEKCPQDFIPSLNHIFGYLEQESYVMRNASLTVMANLIIKVLHKSEQEDERILRDELLDALLAHVRDVVGYTRSKALTLWCSLCENECIPLTYLAPITKAAVNRLSDKACLVRKNAVKFIICILSRNPFGLDRLPLDVFVNRYESENAVLEKLESEEKKKIEREEEIVETLSQSSQNTLTSDVDAKELHPNLKIKNLVFPEESSVEAQRRKVNFLQDAITFTKLIQKAIPITAELLHSKSSTDVQEAIDFFVNCHEFGIDGALVGFKQMILLINEQEKSVKETIVTAYKRIFFESSRYEDKPNKDSLIVTNFINFVQTATIGECISFERLIGLFLQSGEINKEMESELWARFTKAKANTSIDESIAAVQIIGMLAATKPDLINHNFGLCIQYGLASNGCSEQESRLVRETCLAIRKSIPRKLEDSKRRPMRLSREDNLFVRLGEILVQSLTNMESEHWFSMCNEAVRIIFDTAENPEKICESIFQAMVDQLLKNSVQSNHTGTQDNDRNESPELVFQPSSIQATSSSQSQSQSQNPNQNQTMELVNPIALARLIHFLGDVALDLAVFLELHVLLELKMRNASINQNDESRNNISALNISISSRRRSRRYGGAANKSIDDQNLDEEIGLGGAEAEDAEMEFIGSICDEEIVCGKNLLAKLSRVIIEVATDPIRYHKTELKQASSLALAKYMMVSAKYCHDHIRLLFTILEKTKDREIKINLLVAISDLCIRFPNQLDGWTGKIFDCLQCEEVSVRRTALKVLSRLVLCDILKAKDQISTMANLIVDEDEQIASYSRHFFLELSKKLNAVYNVLPDIISRLSDSKTGIPQESFHIVMKFIFELIDKSQHIDRLVDKLCGRFMDTVDERHWSDLAFCLTLLKYSDKSMMKLFDKFDCYKDKLCFDSVRESMVQIIATYRKTPHLKNEMKQMLDEFEAKISKCVGEGGENEEPEEEEGEPGAQDADTDATLAEEEDQHESQEMNSSNTTVVSE